MVESLIPNSSKKMQDKLSLWNESRAIIGSILLITILVACQPAQLVEDAPTPIPTLIPATMPPSGIEPTSSALLIESYPAGLPSANNGNALYDDLCADCHGLDGNGLVPNSRNFGDVDYMRGETPLEFYQIITEGRGQEMPGFGEEISSDDRWDLVYFIWSFSTTNETLQLGKKIYTENCETCHGKDGRSMILGAENFTDHRVMASQSHSDLYVAVTQGVGSMPAWQSRLSQDERWAVIDYVRTFTYDPTIDDQGTISESPDTTDERSECDPYIDQVNPFDWENVDVRLEGEILYANCNGCHGDNGEGNVLGVPDFSEPMFNSKLREDPTGYVCIVAEGINSMPGFKSTMSIEDIWKVMVFIHSLGG